MNKDTLVDMAIQQIQYDIETGDFTAIAELLNFLSKKVLSGYLNDDREFENLQIDLDGGLSAINE